MAHLGNVGYQIYDLKEGSLLVVGSSKITHLTDRSQEYVEELLVACIEEAVEEDIYIDHKLNRGMLGGNDG